MKDRALQTAHELLAHSVCECGDLDGEHISGDAPRECCECECEDFKPVAFAITRLPAITAVVNADPFAKNPTIQGQRKAGKR